MVAECRKRQLENHREPTKKAENNDTPDLIVISDDEREEPASCIIISDSEDDGFECQKACSKSNDSPSTPAKKRTFYRNVKDEATTSDGSHEVRGKWSTDSHKLPKLLKVNGEFALGREKLRFDPANVKLEEAGCLEASENTNHSNGELVKRWKTSPESQKLPKTSKDKEKCALGRDDKPIFDTTKFYGKQTTLHHNDNTDTTVIGPVKHSKKPLDNQTTLSKQPNGANSTSNTQLNNHATNHDGCSDSNTVINHDTTTVHSQNGTCTDTCTINNIPGHTEEFCTCDDATFSGGPSSCTVESSSGSHSGQKRKHDDKDVPVMRLPAMTKRKRNWARKRKLRRQKQESMVCDQSQMPSNTLTQAPSSFNHVTATEPPCSTPPTSTLPTISTPRTSTPCASTPCASTPCASTPCASTPRASTPRASTPRASTPCASTPRASTPRASTPCASTPHTNRPTTSKPHANRPSTSRTSKPTTSTPHARRPTTSTPHTSSTLHEIQQNEWTHTSMASLQQLQKYRHIIFIDLDNWGKFFGMAYCIPSNIFVWTFYGGQTKPPMGGRLFHQLMKEKRLYIHPKCGGTKNAADFALTMMLARLDLQLPTAIPFTVLSGDHGFQEIQHQLKSSQRQIHVINPHHQDLEIVAALLASIGDT